MSIEHFDVLIVGAGISGISAGYYLQTNCPARRYAILEGRTRHGRNLGSVPLPRSSLRLRHVYARLFLRPWKEAKAIADGPAILKYLRDTAQEFGIGRHIRFQHRVRSAAWSSEQCRWTVDAEAGQDRQPVRFTCNFLFLCSGYYDYEKGHTPAFPGSEDFQGKLIHPQHWPKDLDYRGRRVVVIGSGATAVTLVPAMAEQAEHVTMLQRSPSYILSIPGGRPPRRMIRRLLPEWAAHRLIRWKNVLIGMYFYHMCKRSPEQGQEVFSPPPPEGASARRGYRCAFQAALSALGSARLLRARRRSVPRHAGRPGIGRHRQIVKFTRSGILLQSGQELPADIIVTATGLKLLACGGIRLSVDGTDVEPGKMPYLQGVDAQQRSQLAICVGYTNASWTLRAELVVRLFLSAAQLHGPPRLLRMRPALRSCRRTVPTAAGPDLGLRPAWFRPVSQAGLASAVGSAPELHPRPVKSALRQDRRRHPGVLQRSASPSTRHHGH